MTFEDVSFSYTDDGKEVLSEINLHVSAGENVALVGPSGGGKTTLCNLIPRFYDVTGGRILVDGQDVREVTLKSLRSQIGFVQQDVYLFPARCIKISSTESQALPGRKWWRPPNGPEPTNLLAGCKMDMIPMWGRGA